MTTKLIFDITLTIIIIYIFFIYNVEHATNVSETQTYKEIKDFVKKIYNEDVEDIRYLSDVAKKLHTDSYSLTIPGQLIVDNTTDQTGEIIFTDCFANGNITIGSNNALIKQNGDISGNNLILKGNISNIGNITVTKGIISGNQIQLKNTLKKDNWIISNIKSNNDTINNNNKLSFMRMNEDIENGSALDLYDDGNVKIPGNLKVDILTADNVLIKRNRAQYIRVGNMQSTDLYNLFGIKKDATTSDFAVNNYWSLIEIRVFDREGINRSSTSNDTGVSVKSLKGIPYTRFVKSGIGVYATSKEIYSANENKITNIINGEIYSNPNKPSDNLSITNIKGYHGDTGKHQLEIDLVNEYDISYIELYNRFSNILDTQIMINGDVNKKYSTSLGFDGIAGEGINVSSRMNGTIVELISAIPPGKTEQDRIINRSIHTGLWTDVYFKQYTL
jgi:hypothetical protein